MLGPARPSYLVTYIISRIVKVLTLAILRPNYLIIDRLASTPFIKRKANKVASWNVWFVWDVWLAVRCVADLPDLARWLRGCGLCGSRGSVGFGVWLRAFVAMRQCGCAAMRLRTCIDMW